MDTADSRKSRKVGAARSSGDSRSESKTAKMLCFEVTILQVGT